MFCWIPISRDIGVTNPVTGRNSMLRFAGNWPMAGIPLSLHVLSPLSRQRWPLPKMDRSDGSAFVASAKMDRSDGLAVVASADTLPVAVAGANMPYSAVNEEGNADRITLCKPGVVYPVICLNSIQCSPGTSKAAVAPGTLQMVSPRNRHAAPGGAGSMFPVRESAPWATGSSVGGCRWEGWKVLSWAETEPTTSNQPASRGTADKGLFFLGIVGGFMEQWSTSAHMQDAGGFGNCEKFLGYVFI